MGGAIPVLLQVLSVVSALFQTAGEIADVLEKESPNGNGPQKKEAFNKTMQSVLETTNGMVEEDEQTPPKMKEALMSLASEAADTVVKLRNASGKYQHSSSTTEPPEVISV